MRLHIIFLTHFVHTGKPIKSSAFNEKWREAVDAAVENICNRYEADFDSLDQLDPIDESEIDEAIYHLKNRKAPGFDEITAEHLKEAKGIANATICMYVCIDDQEQSTIGVAITLRVRAG